MASKLSVFIVDAVAAWNLFFRSFFFPLFIFFYNIDFFTVSLVFFPIHRSVHILSLILNLLILLFYFTIVHGNILYWIRWNHIHFFFRFYVFKPIYNICYVFRYFILILLVFLISYFLSYLSNFALNGVY